MPQLLVTTSKQPAGRLCFFSSLNDATNLVVQQDLFLFDIRSVSTSLPETFCVCFVRSQGLYLLRGCVTLLGIRWI